MKQCVGRVTLDQVDGYFDINCEEVSGPFWVAGSDGTWCMELPMDQLTTAPSRAEKAPSTLSSSLNLRPKGTGSAIP